MQAAVRTTGFRWRKAVQYRVWARADSAYQYDGGVMTQSTTVGTAPGL